MAGYTHPVEMSCGLVKDKLSLHTWEPHCLSIPESTLRWHLPSPGLSPETMAGPEPLMYWPYMGEHSVRGLLSQDTGTHSPADTAQMYPTSYACASVSSSVTWRF